MTLERQGGTWDLPWPCRVPRRMCVCAFAHVCAWEHLLHVCVSVPCVCVCSLDGMGAWGVFASCLWFIHTTVPLCVCGGGLHVYKGLCIDVFKWSFLYVSIGMYLCIFPWWCLSRWVWLFMSVFVKLYGWVCHCAWKHEPCVYICVWIYLYCVIVYVDCRCLCVYVLWVFFFFSSNTDCMGVCISVWNSGNSLALNQTTKSWNFYGPHLLARCKLYLQLPWWLVLFHIFNIPGLLKSEC